MRKNWLSAVMVIMYKYNFSPDTAMGERVSAFELKCFWLYSDSNLDSQLALTQLLYIKLN